MHAIDLVGRRYGKLLVVRRGQSRGAQNKPHWLCRCICGVEKEISGAHLRQGTIQSCGCAKHGSENPAWSGCGEITGSFWARAENSARHRHQYRRRGNIRQKVWKLQTIPFDISIDFAWNLFLKQNRKCALSGVSLSFGSGSSTQAQSKGTASLDRIDSSVGYIGGNVQWVHKDINRMKNTFSQEHFREMCRQVAENK